MGAASAWHRGAAVGRPILAWRQIISEPTDPLGSDRKLTGMAEASEALRTYAIDGGADGKRRLDVLARVQGESTLALLHAAGIRPGMRCLDVGCGGGHVTLEMARLIGRWGRVVGIDADPVIVELARADASAAGFENVTIETGDALHPDRAGDRYHLAYSRYLLSHVSHPDKVLAAMVDALEPGGVLAVEDVDFRGAFCDPASRAFDRSLELYRAVVAHRGGDADFGPRLPALLRAAGLELTGVRVVQPAYVEGEGKIIPYLTLERVGQAVVEAGIASRRVLTDTLRELRVFTERSDTLLGLPRTVQAWARKIT
jgi:2-polyprenyl-3-methyl-5-hydroxy-6-metoxy-1,4-benzoquinol methylase